jgi:hypothetical protein
MENSMRKLVWCGWLLMLTAARAGAQPAGACAGEHFHELDFWVGRWSVQNPAGQPAGTSVVERIAEGCGLLETYTGAPGPRGGHYVGVGLHAFDEKARTWHQTFTDNRPAITLMIGRRKASGVVYEWQITDAQGRRIAKRYTLSTLVNGVRQLGEQSLDGGTTWTLDFDLRYTRAS